MGFPKGASIPFGQGRGQNPAREVASFIGWRKFCIDELARTRHSRRIASIRRAAMKLLENVRVLDLTNVLAGPFCCYQLAQLGADVIKIEAPSTGDLARQLGADAELNRRLMGASFLAQNAGKRSLTINLKSRAGKAVFRRLVATADVVVENFRPGVMDRLGFGYPELNKIKPDLVYCAISGFGQNGALKDNPAYDQIVQGLSGVMSITAPRRFSGGRHHWRHHRGIRRRCRAVPARAQRRRGIYRCLHARIHARSHGLGSVQLAYRRRQARTVGQ